MTSPAFYVETSVWGSLASRQPRDRAQVVRRLLRLLDGVHGKRLQYESVNRLHGYLRTPLICNPFEACDELRHG